MKLLRTSWSMAIIVGASQIPRLHGRFRIKLRKFLADAFSFVKSHAKSRNPPCVKAVIFRRQLPIQNFGRKTFYFLLEEVRETTRQTRIVSDIEPHWLRWGGTGAHRAPFTSRI